MMPKQMLKRMVWILFALLLIGCVKIPENVKPVNNFRLDKYLGKWYEIARLDHSFERGLSRVTADYSLGEDGSVKVINRGYAAKEQEWREATGKACFVQRRRGRETNEEPSSDRRDPTEDSLRPAYLNWL